MDNEKNEKLNDEKVQQVKDDVSAKIADAASEIKEEIAEADEAAKEVAEEVKDAVSDKAEEVKDAVSDKVEEVEDAVSGDDAETESDPESEDGAEEALSETEAAPKKEPKSINLSVGALVGIIVGCLAVAALVVFLIMNYVNGQPKYGKAEGKTIATVNGEKLTDEDMGYYIYAAATDEYYNIEGDNATGDLEGYDWDQDVDGRKLSDIIKEKAYDTAISEIVTGQMADEVLTGEYVWDEQDEQQIQMTVDSYVQQFGEDGFNLRAKSMGISSANEYARMYTRVMKAQNVQAELEENLDQHIPEGVDLSQYVQSDKCSAKHILLMVADTSDPSATPDPDAYDDATAAALAQEISDRAKNGEDFDSLMEQYNQDTGETTAGYTFGTGEMVPEFEEAAFALGLGEVSGPVKSDYGYHVIKRIPGMYELQGYWKSQAKISENKSNYDKISVQGIMDGVYQSGKQLQEEQAAASSSSSSSSGSSSSDSSATSAPAGE